MATDIEEERGRVERSKGPVASASKEVKKMAHTHTDTRRLVQSINQSINQSMKSTTTLQASSQRLVS